MFEILESKNNIFCFWSLLLLFFDLILHLDASTVHHGEGKSSEIETSLLPVHGPWTRRLASEPQFP